jgi:hypothetical protein
MSVLLVLCAVDRRRWSEPFAAAMGNPVRIGHARAGPEGAVERAVSRLSARSMAAVLPVVLMNRGPGGEPFTVANATSTPEPPGHLGAGHDLSPTPPAGPSAVAAPPGVPAVTSIGQPGPATGCARHSSRPSTSAPGRNRYRVYVNGAVVGDPNRNFNVNGAEQTARHHPGDGHPQWCVDGPRRTGAEPTILTGTAVWTAPAARDPARADQHATAADAGAEQLSVTGPATADACTDVTSRLDHRDRRFGSVARRPTRSWWVPSRVSDNVTTGRPGLRRAGPVPPGRSLPVQITANAQAPRRPPPARTTQ